MPKVFPCYAQHDRELAQELAAFLERGAGVEVLLEEGEMRPGDDLIAKVQEGLSYDVVLVLLSPRSVPDRWILERWRSAFWEQAAQVGTLVAALLCEDCKFPPLLQRQNFFDLRRQRLQSFRLIKHWLMSLWPAPQPSPFIAARQSSFEGCESALETLCALVADEPGTAVVANAARGSGKTALALEFCYRHHEDFHAVFWLNCGGRSASALAGDLAAQAGLRLDRDLESNLNQLRNLCARHRCLLVLDDAVAETAPLLVSRGRTSVLATTRQPHLAEVLAARTVAPDQRAPAAPFELDPHTQNLLNAMCACSPYGFRLDIAAHLAQIDMRQAHAGAKLLQAKGLLMELDQTGPRFVVPEHARHATGNPPGRLAHARAMAVLFDAQNFQPDDLTQLWPDLQYAIDGALEFDWALANSLLRRAVGWARAHERLAEAFELLEKWSRAAERRPDRRALDESAWEQIWILEHWGRASEARILDGVRRKQYGDQLAFDFVQS